MRDELNPSARSLIDSARRSGRALEPRRKARLRLAVASAIGASTAATAGTLSVAKLVLVGALSAAVGSGATFAVIRSTNKPVTPAAPPLQVQPAAPKSKPPPLPEVHAQPEAAVEPPPVVVAELPVVPPTRRPPAPRLEVPSPPPAPTREPEATPEIAPAPRPAPVSSAAEGLAQELELLGRVLTATQELRWLDAQRGLDEHARRFQPAALHSEARALQVTVWCGVERVDDARKLARELERTDPLNPAVQRLRGTCADVR